MTPKIVVRALEIQSQIKPLAKELEALRKQIKEQELFGEFDEGRVTVEYVQAFEFEKKADAREFDRLLKAVEDANNALKEFKAFHEDEKIKSEEIRKVDIVPKK